MKRIVFHSSVQRDADSALRYYQSESEQLGDNFWQAPCEAFAQIEKQPEHYHFDPSGYRRFGLERFPYYNLFEVLADRVRVVVVRHNSRRPGFGTRRKW